MTTTSEITQAHRDAINGRLDAMKAADPGTRDRTMYDDAVAVDSSQQAMGALLEQGRRAAPDLITSRVCEVVEAWFDAETGNRNSNKRAAISYADGDPRETPTLPDVATVKGKMTKGGGGPPPNPGNDGNANPNVPPDPPAHGKPE